MIPVSHKIPAVALIQVAVIACDRNRVDLVTKRLHFFLYFVGFGRHDDHAKLVQLSRYFHDTEEALDLVLVAVYYFALQIYLRVVPDI
jgi:hypothetical protein